MPRSNSRSRLLKIFGALAVVALAVAGLAYVVFASPQDDGAVNHETQIRRPALEVSSDAGTVWVPLVAPDDGPTWLTLGNAPGTAVQVLAEPAPEDRGVEVTLGFVEGLRDEQGPSTRPLSRFVVGIEDPPGTVAQLEQIGLDDWRFSLGSTEYLEKGCADCGELRCCAAKGYCIECGLCGQVCNEPEARSDPDGGDEDEEGETNGDSGGGGDDTDAPGDA